MTDESGPQCDARSATAAASVDEGDKKNPAAIAPAACTVDKPAADGVANGAGLASIDESLSLRTTDKPQQPVKHVDSRFLGCEIGIVQFGATGVSESRRTWSEQLIAVQRDDYAGVGDESDPVFAQACAALSSFRVVVLRHQNGCQQRAESLLKQVSYWATGREPHRKLLGVANDFALQLGELAMPEAWPQQFHGSLVMLERRQEPMTTRFLSSNNSAKIKMLCQRLESSDARLLITLAAEYDAGEGSLDPFDKCIRTLEVANAAKPPPAEARLAVESSFDVIPRMIAGLFEGLKVEEFRALVDDLAVGLDPLQTASAPSPDDAKSLQRAAEPTRHQRWKAGEIDHVLAELGVQYVVSGVESSASNRGGRASGYYLADSGSSLYGEPGWVITRNPMLLANRCDRLLDRYLGSAMSARFGEAFMALVARLDGAGVREASAEWLMAGWKRAISASAEVDAAAKSLCALVEYLQPSDGRADLALAVIDRLASGVVEAELLFQHEAGLAPLVGALEALTVEGQVDAGRLWEQLMVDADVGVSAQRMSESLSASLWAMLRLSSRWPAEVARAVARVLAEVTAPATPWRRMARDLQPLDLAPRLVPRTLDNLLNRVVPFAPAVWTGFAKGVVLAFESSVREALARPVGWRCASSASERLAEEGQRLALASLCSLAPHVYSAINEEWLKLIVPIDASTAEVPGLLGRLLAMSRLESDVEPALWLAGQGELSATDIVRFLRGIAIGLQQSKVLRQEEAGPLLSQLTDGLRDLLPLNLRRELQQRARDSVESLVALRDHLEEIEARDSLAEIRRRIRATQAVIRNLSAPKQSTARGRATG